MVARWVAAWLLAAGSPGPDAQVARFPLLTTATVERFELPASGVPYSLALDTLGSSLTVRPNTPLPGLGKQLKGTLCQAEAEVAGGWRLHCKTTQFDAFLSREGRELIIIELRGLPWQQGADGPPRVIYPADALGLNDGCPGTDPAMRGECAFAEGKLAEAQAYFHDALKGSNAPFAALRLGDLDLLRNDPEAALGHFLKAGNSLPFGMLAQERASELAGTDVNDFALGSFGDESAVARQEMGLRLARRKAFHGNLGEAAQDLLEHPEDGTCALDARLCRRILLGALREPSVARAKALALYLRLPDRQEGPLVVELAEAASDDAAELGAPRFAANLRAALFPKVAKERQAAYLKRTAELFVAAGDDRRAEVICEFARTRFPTLAECGKPQHHRQESGAHVRAVTPKAPPRAWADDVQRDLATAAKAVASVDLPAEEMPAGAADAGVAKPSKR